MPIAPCMDSSGNERLVTMRNIQIDIWDLTNGKILKTVDNKIQDWTTHHEGKCIEQRHLMASKQYVIYAGYRAHEFYIMDIDSPANHRKVQLFEPYKYDKTMEAPDFTLPYKEHISTLAIDSKTEVVLCCNGPTRSIHIISITDGQELRVVKGDRSMGKIVSFYCPPCSDQWHYFLCKNMVSGQIVYYVSFYCLPCTDQWHYFLCKNMACCSCEVVLKSEQGVLLGPNESLVNNGPWNVEITAIKVWTYSTSTFGPFLAVCRRTISFIVSDYHI